MKKAFAVMMIGLMVAGSSMAQQIPQKDKRTQTERQEGKYKKSNLIPEEQAVRRTEKMTKEFGLSDSQAKKIQALHLQQLKERQAMRAQYKSKDAANREQRKAEVKAAHDREQAELKSILTPQQYASYQQKRDEMRAKQGERRGRENFKHREGMQQGD